MNLKKRNRRRKEGLNWNLCYENGNKMKISLTKYLNLEFNSQKGEYKRRGEKLKRIHIKIREKYNLIYMQKSTPPIPKKKEKRIANNLWMYKFILWEHGRHTINSKRTIDKFYPFSY